MSLVAELIAITEELAPDAQRAILYFARRLHGGQQQYGRLDLHTDTRDFAAEMKAEDADGIAYRIFELIRNEYRKESVTGSARG